MSKLVYICTRRAKTAADLAPALENLARRLTPDNLACVPPRILDCDGIVMSIFNPNELMHTASRSICVGYLAQTEGWDRLCSGRPDGAYALFRSDDHHVEVLSDALASRTIWYFKSDELFIAATSQRAIVALAGSFAFDAEVIPWMLSSGTLGPRQAWDRRIRRLEGAATLLLNRRSWELSVKTEPVHFVPEEATDETHAARVRGVLDRVVGAARLDCSQWVFPLSGGIDCRTLLCLLQDKAGLRTVTWGVRASLRQRDNDARVARDLARHLGLAHRYYETDLSDEPIEALFNRFVICGEGRIDHLSGYMDGFHIWKALHESGMHGIIRGDQVFGRKSVASPKEARNSAGMPLWTDFAELPPLAQLGLAAQEMPQPLLQRQDESLATWRDRLQQQFRVPVVLAALSDLKLPYVEIITPLLCGSIVAEIRKLPDRLRTEKALLRSIAHSLSPPVRFARYAATQPAGDVLKSPRVVEFLRAQLSTPNARAVVSGEFIDYVINRMVVAGRAQQSRYWRNLKRSAASYLSWRPKKAPPKRAPPTYCVDFNRLAFRAVLICRMHATLSEDAAALRQAAS